MYSTLMNTAPPIDYSDASFLEDRQAIMTLLQNKDAQLHAQNLLIEKLKHPLAVLRRGKFGSHSKELEHERLNGASLIPLRGRGRRAPFPSVRRAQQRTRKRLFL